MHVCALQARVAGRLSRRLSTKAIPEPPPSSGAGKTVVSFSPRIGPEKTLPGPSPLLETDRPAQQVAMAVAGGGAFTVYRATTDEATKREVDAFRSGKEGASIARVAQSVVGSAPKPLAPSTPKVPIPSTPDRATAPFRIPPPVYPISIRYPLGCRSTGAAAART